MTTAPGAIIPAAGASRRFGSDKLVHRVDGVPMLARVLAALRDGGAGEVLVVVADLTSERAEVARGAGARCAVVDDPTAGMLATIRAGLAQVAPGSVLICPADLPYLAPTTVAAVLAAAAAKPAALVVPVVGDQRGHPLVVPADLRAAIDQLDPTVGLRGLRLGHPDRVHSVAVDDLGCVRDIDQPTDFGLPR